MRRLCAPGGGGGLFAAFVGLLCCWFAALLSLLLCVWGVCAGVLLALVVGLVLYGALVVLGVSLLLCCE